MEDLPNEVLSNIFQRLPTKSLGLCMCVKKPWLSIIKTPWFVSSYTQNNKNPPLILWKSNYDVELCLDDESLEFHKRFRFPLDEFDVFPRDNRIGICNGLICFLEDDFSSIILWNLTIQKKLSQPEPNFTIFYEHSVNLNPGFGFDSLSDDYKVIRVLIFRDWRPSQVEVFSLNRNSWKIISKIHPRYAHFSGPSLTNKGALYWLVSCYDDVSVIVAFDLNDEVFREIPFPEACMIS
ncbi:F-box protein At3g07870-like [Rutidosis leptorrhynchoides]|uniref:F-box protein At3g07870-like n=1 Tax=Rutidosis leptorrhynchoides TaxID=125765 RepID=UPI003A99D3CF